jgi:hypothetical protein
MWTLEDSKTNTLKSFLAISTLPSNSDDGVLWRARDHVWYADDARTRAGDTVALLVSASSSNAKRFVHG